MNQDQLERIEYTAQASKDAGIMLVIAPDVILELLENFRASIELLAIREKQLQEEIESRKGP